jgi:hypothetical protein
MNRYIEKFYVEGILQRKVSAVDIPHLNSELLDDAKNTLKSRCLDSTFRETVVSEYLTTQSRCARNIRIMHEFENLLVGMNDTTRHAVINYLKALSLYIEIIDGGPPCDELISAVEKDTGVMRCLSDLLDTCSDAVRDQLGMLSN